MAPVLKTGVPERVPGVRIPPSPPDFLGFYFQPLQGNSEPKGSAYGFQGILRTSVLGSAWEGKDRRYIPIDLGRRSRRSKEKEEVTGQLCLWYEVKYESAGPDFPAAVGAMQRSQARLRRLGQGRGGQARGGPNRKRVVDEVKKFLTKKSLLKDPKPA